MVFYYFIECRYSALKLQHYLISFCFKKKNFFLQVVRFTYVKLPFFFFFLLTGLLPCVETITLVDVALLHSRT